MRRTRLYIASFNSPCAMKTFRLTSTSCACPEAAFLSALSTADLVAVLMVFISSRLPATVASADFPVLLALCNLTTHPVACAYKIAASTLSLSSCDFTLGFKTQAPVCSFFQTTSQPEQASLSFAGSSILFVMAHLRYTITALLLPCHSKALPPCHWRTRLSATPTFLCPSPCLLRLAFSSSCTGIPSNPKSSRMRFLRYDT